MMDQRWTVFWFSNTIPEEEQKDVPPCGACFNKLLFSAQLYLKQLFCHIQTLHKFYTTLCFVHRPIFRFECRALQRYDELYRYNNYSYIILL